MSALNCCWYTPAANRAPGCREPTVRTASPYIHSHESRPGRSGRLAYDDQHRVGRPDVALAIRAEHGEGVIARLQILHGELGRPLRQLAHLLRPVVQLQLLPA